VESTVIVDPWTERLPGITTLLEPEPNVKLPLTTLIVLLALPTITPFA